jgi:predicted Abi (CAAX) family protease
MANHTNFLLILIIVSLAMFILLCPRKTDTTTPTEDFAYHSNMPQQQPQYLPPEVELVPNLNRTGQEFTKAATIQQMNMDYDTRGDINDLVNLNQLPHEGTMFVYP